jgi:LVIVD repeat
MSLDSALGTAVCDSIPELGCDSSLEVVDLSQTVTPTIMQKLSFQGVPKAIVLSGHLAFVAAWSDGLASSSFLAVYDTSEGTLSPLTTSVPIANAAEDLVLCGQFACVATWNGLSVLDLSDLAAIHEIGRFTYSPPSNAPSGISSLAIDGSFAYLTDAYNGLLVVVDLSDPARPRELARLQMPGSGGGVIFSDGYLYASNAMGGFSIYQTAAAAGQVRDVNGRPYSGVTIYSDLQALGASGLGGAFTLDARPGQTLSLRPQMLDYAFWPPVRTVTDSVALRGQDFTILPSPVSASLEQGITTTLRYTDTAGLLTEFSLPPAVDPGAGRVIVTPTVASPPSGLVFAGHAFELAFQPAEGQLQSAYLGAPISVTIAYSRLDTRLVSDEMKLNLYRWDGQAWIDAAAACTAATQPQRDPGNHLFRLDLCLAGRYALMGPTLRQFMPIVIRQP